MLFRMGQKYRSNCWLLVLLLVGIVLSGCRKAPEMAHVRGHVFYKDGTVPHGGTAVVRLEPTEDTTAKVRKGASSTIAPDGSFDIWTRIPGDGVYLGKYRVSFAVWQSPTDPKSLIQDKYISGKTSGYEVDVDDDKDGLKFEIEQLPGVKGAPAVGG